MDCPNQQLNVYSKNSYMLNSLTFDLVPQVLVIFSDGLNEDVMRLEHQSELLKQSGKH